MRLLFVLVKVFLRKFGLDPGADKFPPEIYAFELIPEGWEIVEDVAPTLKSAFELGVYRPPLRRRAHGKRLEDVRAHGKEKGISLGFSDLRVALVDSANISVGLRQYYIVFSGTVFRGPSGRLCIAYLFYGTGGWRLDWEFLSDDWYGIMRLARVKTAA